MKKPVLFLIFNRPDYTRAVFESIKLYKPTRLYIAADGVRLNNKEDIIKCEETRNIVNLIDWDCEIKTLFRNENLGCKLAVAGAIDWFFENEEDGIILEDDVVPNQAFYTFCEFTLNKYKDDERVMMITGTNFISDKDLYISYFFSKLYVIWGWATWRRAWKLYDRDMKQWEDNQVRADIRYMTHNHIWNNYINTFDSIRISSIDTWDIQWEFSCLINNGLCVTPKVNLVTNIGVFGTHSSSVTKHHFLEKTDFEAPENYTLPTTFIINSLYDQKFTNRYKIANFKFIVIRFLRRANLYKTFRRVKKIFVHE